MAGTVSIGIALRSDDRQPAKPLEIQLRGNAEGAQTLGRAVLRARDQWHPRNFGDLVLGMSSVRRSP